MGLLARVASALGFRQRATRIPGALRGRVVPDQSLWLQHVRIGGGLTPKDVTEIIRQADFGTMWRLMDLANEARQKDCHLQAVLSQSEESIAGLDWQLILPEGARAKDKRAAKWCEDYLRSCASFPRLIAHLTGAVFYGYAVSEIVWGKQDGKLVPVCFEHLAPRRFAFRLDDGAFIWRDMNMPWDGVDFITTYPDKFVVSRPRVTGDVPSREGLVRVLMWAALFRNWTMSDWLRTGEIAWKPWRIGQYEKGASSEDIDTLTAVMDGLTSNGVAVLPQTVKYEIMWPASQGSKPLHSELFNVVAQEMSKAALGQTETTQSSSSSGYAQAKVHQAVRADLLESRARSIAADLTRDVIERMIRLNFGPDCVVPNLVFVTQEGVDLQAFALAVSTLVAAGLKVPQSWVREQAGVPEPEDDEDLMGGGAVDIPIDPVTGLPTEPPANDPPPVPEALPEAA